VPQAAELDLNPVVVSPGGWAVVDLKLRLAPSSVDIDRATLRMLGRRQRGELRGTTLGDL